MDNLSSVPRKIQRGYHSVENAAANLYIIYVTEPLNLLLIPLTARATKGFPETFEITGVS